MVTAKNIYDRKFTIMSKKSIDHRFQNALDDYVSGVDDNEIWQAIEGRIPRKRKKRRMLIWMIFGALLLTGLFLASIYYSNAEKLSSGMVERSDIEEYQPKTNIQSELPGQKNDKVKKDEFSAAESMAFSQSKAPELILESKNRSQQLFEGSEETPEDHKDSMEEGYEKLADRSKNVDENKVAISSIPTLLDPIRIDKREIIQIDGPVGISIPLKRKKPFKYKPTFIGMNYLAGRSFTRRTVAGNDVNLVDYGEDYFSHGVAFSYNRFLTSGFYGRVVVAVDQTFKKYEDRVSRDTLVPSSAGAQVISLSEYISGIIDTESGIPIVKGSYNRDILHLNSTVTISLGLGLGWKQRIGHWHISVEADIQRSLHHGLSGFGRASSSEVIRDLDVFSTYFSTDPKYAINGQMNMGYQISKTMTLQAGVQFQNGLSSSLFDPEKHVEKINLLRGSVGLRKKYVNEFLIKIK